MKTIRIAQYPDSDRGGRRVDKLVESSKRIIMRPGGYCEITTRELWKDIGTLMNPVLNHVPEQPKSLAHKLLQKRMDEVACREATAREV